MNGGLDSTPLIILIKYSPVIPMDSRINPPKIKVTTIIDVQPATLEPLKNNCFVKISVP